MRSSFEKCNPLETTSSDSAMKKVFNVGVCIAEPPSPTGEGHIICTNKNTGDSHSCSQKIKKFFAIPLTKQNQGAIIPTS